MKVNTQKLSHALKNLSCIMKSRAHMPILQCAKLSGSGSELTIECNNLDEHMAEFIEISGEAGTCCVMLSRLQRALGGEDMDLLIHPHQLMVHFHSNEIALSTQKVDEFPERPTGKFTKVGVNCVDLAHGLDAVKWAASRDGVRYLLNSVNLRGTPKEIVAQATTTREFCRHTMPALSSEFNIMVPTEFAANVSNALRRDGAVLSLSENRLKIEYDGGEYACKLLEGKYPDTDSVINGQIEPIGEFNLEEMKDCFERCKFISDGMPSPSVELEFDGMYARANCAGSIGAVQFDVSGKFNSHKCIVNPASFAACLAVLEGDKIKIGYLPDAQKALHMVSGNLVVANTVMSRELKAKKK